MKGNIVRRHVTGERIFVDDNTYKNLMTAAHVKDMVNRTATLKNPPGRQVDAMGRGGGRVRGTDRGGREGRGGRGGRGQDSGRGRGDYSAILDRKS